MSNAPDNVPKMDPLRRVGEDKMGIEPEKGGQGFEAYMQKAGEAPATGKSIGVSPFDLVHGQTVLPTAPSFDSLLHQVKAAQTMLGDMSNDLHTKNLKLKRSEKSLLRSKLQNATGHLRSVNKKMGVQIPPEKEEQEEKKGGILGKFLNFIADGQGNLVAAQKQLLSLKGKGDTLQPADFLAIQLKLAHAQQEIEYASVMLGKAVDNLKTLMNIQL